MVGGVVYTQLTVDAADSIPGSVAVHRNTYVPNVDTCAEIPYDVVVPLADSHVTVEDGGFVSTDHVYTTVPAGPSSVTCIDRATVGAVEKLGVACADCVTIGIVFVTVTEADPPKWVET
jgi:hypothetical protein